MFENSVVTSKACGKCKKNVPLLSEVGMRCPHCRAYWGVNKNVKVDLTPTKPKPKTLEEHLSESVIAILCLAVIAVICLCFFVDDGDWLAAMVGLVFIGMIGIVALLVRQLARLERKRVHRQAQKLALGYKSALEREGLDPNANFTCGFCGKRMHLTGMCITAPNSGECRPNLSCTACFDKRRLGPWDGKTDGMPEEKAARFAAALKNAELIKNVRGID